VGRLTKKPPRTEPTTIPAICPPERPWFELVFSFCSAPCDALAVLDEVGELEVDVLDGDELVDVGEEDDSVVEARTGRK